MPSTVGGVTNKRARSRQRHKKARRSDRTSKECADVIDLHACPGAIEWVYVQYGRWPTILTQPEDCEDLEEKISDFTQEESVRAIASYEHFHLLPRGSGLLEMLATYSCGIAGRLEFDSTLPIDIGESGRFWRFVRTMGETSFVCRSRVRVGVDCLHC